MSDQYKYVGKNLTPGIAEELIQELFAGQTVQIQKIMRTVDETHLERGGLPSTTKGHPPVRNALSKMKRKGLAENPRHRYWSILSSTQSDDSVDSEPNDVKPEKTIGSGKQSVYLYYYPTYRRLAESQGEVVWACKIGKASFDAIHRIGTQTRTALPEYPKVGLIIKTDAHDLMERTIQNILKLRGKQKRDAPGTEWFITSPSEVEQVYEKILGIHNKKEDNYVHRDG